MSKSTSSVQQVSNHIEEIFVYSEDVHCSIVLALVHLFVRMGGTCRHNIAQYHHPILTAMVTVDVVSIRVSGSRNLNTQTTLTCQECDQVIIR